jgi:tape measure domain-containing protein
MNQEVQYTLTLKDLLIGKIKQADDAVNKFEGTLGKAQGAAMNLASAVGVAFGTAAVVAFGQKMVQAGTQVEDALVGLTTLLKDKAEAQQVINNTMEDAAKTPFAFEGLLAANKALISAGISAETARADVLNLANAIAATGGTDVEMQRMVVNLQGVATLGKAMGKDINQFAYAGINIYKVLADATGQPIEKIQDMEISYDMLTMALRKAGEAGGMFENGLVNMANNTSIKISGLGDNVFKLSAQMFMDLKPAIDSIISGLYSFIDILTIGWNWLVQNKDIVMALAIGVGVATVAYQAYLLSMGQGIIVTGLMTVAQWALNVAMNANPLGLIITGIAVLTAGIE